MKRRLVMILLLLVGGAIVNVALAWGCGNWVRFAERATASGTHSNHDTEPVTILAFRSFGSQQVVIDHKSKVAAPADRSENILDRLHAAEFQIAMMEAHEPDRLDVLPRWTTLGEHPDDRAPTIAPDDPWAFRHEFTLHDARGWPFRTLVSRWHASERTAWQWTPITQLESVLDEDQLRLRLIMWPDNTVMLPLRPLWPGFAINTVFYAAILWLLFAGPFVLRRWRRIRRGLCPKCAYDLRGTRGGARGRVPGVR